MYNLRRIRGRWNLLVLENEGRVVPTTLWHFARQPEDEPVAVGFEIVFVDSDLKIGLPHVKNKNNLHLVQYPLN